MGHRVVSGIVCFTLLMLLLAPANFCTREVGAGPLTIVTTSFYDASATVDVSPGATGACVLNGSVDVTTYDPQPITVYLSVDCSVGAATVSPATFVLTPPQASQAFSISVRIPLGTSMTVIPILTISGTWEQGVNQGSVGGSSACIVILQYFSLNVNCGTPYLEVEPGAVATFSLLVYNQGNGEDVVRVENQNESEMTSDGWGMSDLPKLTVPEGGSGALNMDFHAPSSILYVNYVQAICLTFVSERSETEGNSSSYSTEYHLYVRVKGSSGLGETDSQEEGNETSDEDSSIPGFEAAAALFALVAVLALLVRRRGP